jgi:beta-lactamase class C
MKLIYAMCAIAGLSTSVAAAPSTLRDTVDGVIAPIMKEYDVPGVAVGVIVDGKAQFFNYGVTARSGGAPVSEHTIFELGSISKTFTATLGMLARAEGRLSLDDHPGKYLPALQGAAIDRATLLHLATYTAGGLPLQFPDQADDAADEQATLTYFRDWKPDAAPGAIRRYSNPSIGLFGHAAAAALGTGIATAMETRLFPALGLSSTYIQVPDSAMPRYAWGYDKQNRQVRMQPGALAAEAYGVRSTAADMVRVLQVNIDPSLLQGAARRAVEATHAGYFRTGPMTQALGWERYSAPYDLQRLLAGNSSAMALEPNPTRPLAPPLPPSGTALYNKTGSTGGFGGYAVFIPARKTGVVILANRGYPNAERIKAAYAILKQLGATAR